VVPDTTVAWDTRVVLIKDGVRFDSRFDISGSMGRVIIADRYPIVFEVGYDCLFSFSLIDSAACGLSWSPGEHRGISGALVDAESGKLISSQNPVHQGQLITAWMTGVSGLKRDRSAGLYQVADFGSLVFGVAQNGKDQLSQFKTPSVTWAGESPQFVGLDQVNATFPVCPSKTKATVEKRYDAYLIYSSFDTGTTNKTSSWDTNALMTPTTVRVYVPFVIRPGDPDCNWNILESNFNPVPQLRPVTFTVFLSPIATGKVTFFDNGKTLGTVSLNEGKASFSTSTLSSGTHDISATYSGDINVNGTTSNVITQVVTPVERLATTISLTSKLNPSLPGELPLVTAAVSGGTGTVTLLIDGAKYSSADVIDGKTTFTLSLAPGKYSLKAIYEGDATHSGSVSNELTQTVAAKAMIYLTSRATEQAVVFIATVVPESCTGYVTFRDTSTDNIVVLGTAKVGEGGQASVLTTLSPGNHGVKATYTSDNSLCASTSTEMTYTESSPHVRTTTTIAANVSSTSSGQSVTFTATISPQTATGTVIFMDNGDQIAAGTLRSGQTQYSTNRLSLGSHSISAKYLGGVVFLSGVDVPVPYDASTSNTLLHTVK